MVQGMKDVQVWATSVIGDALSVVTSMTAPLITATSIVPTYNSLIGLGSPPSYTQKIEVGSWTGTAGGSDWVAFPAKFTAIPNVYITPFKGFITTSMVVAGSFMASGTASVAAQWMAIGL
jgi:hypothetical protein